MTQLEALAQQRSVSLFSLAIVRLGLGEKDQALALLERAYAERSEYMPNLNVDPRLDQIRSDPRFQALVRRMSFPG